MSLERRDPTHSGAGDPGRQTCRVDPQVRKPGPPGASFLRRERRREEPIASVRFRSPAAGSSLPSCRDPRHFRRRPAATRGGGRDRHRHRGRPIGSIAAARVRPRARLVWRGTDEHLHGRCGSLHHARRRRLSAAGVDDRLRAGDRLLRTGAGAEDRASRGADPGNRHRQRHAHGGAGGPGRRQRDARSPPRISIGGARRSSPTCCARPRAPW